MAKKGLVAISVIKKVFGVLANQKKSLRSYCQLHQAKSCEVNNSSKSRGERVAIF